MSAESKGIVIPGKGLYLPEHGLVEPHTAAERKRLKQIEDYMHGYPTRIELQQILAEAINDGCNNMLEFILTNFDVRPKTDAGEKALSMMYDVQAKRVEVARQEAQANSEPERQMPEQFAARQVVCQHKSDCSVHNAPAEAAGVCSCGTGGPCQCGGVVVDRADQGPVV